MKTKKLLSIAIMATLPFAANAGYTYVGSDTPAQVPANGTVIKTAPSGPYQTAEIGASDGEHIASTAYVKGAYNDTIAAVNRLTENKQNTLFNDYTGQNIDTEIYGATQLVDDMVDDNANIEDYETTLVSASAIILGIKSQRVEARDTWGSNHTADVALKTVVPEIDY